MGHAVVGFRMVEKNGNHIIKTIKNMAFAQDDTKMEIKKENRVGKMEKKTDFSAGGL